MKLKYAFEITTVGDEIIAVPLDSADQFDGVLSVNETMKDLMELLSVERSEEELTKLMLDRYCNVTQDEMAATVREICARLKDEGLLN